MKIREMVSVNITTYNRAHLLPRCLDSVLAQSYEDMEIIIADDCSSDNTAEIVKEYEQKDDRIKYFRHETNKGNAYARNTALENSTGYYVAFMDDDDQWIDKDKLKKQVEIFESSSNNLGIVCSNVVLVGQDGKVKEKRITPPKDIKSHILSRNGIIYSPTVMTRRNILEKLRGFDTNLKRGVDSEFYRRCIVRFNYEVFFMSEFTTSIHEYGDDRITPSKTIKDRMNIIKANSYLICKYFDQFFMYPQPLLLRFKKIIKTCIKL